MHQESLCNLNYTEISVVFIIFSLFCFYFFITKNNNHLTLRIKEKQKKKKLFHNAMCGHRWGKIVTIIIVGNFTKKLNDYSE